MTPTQADCLWAVAYWHVYCNRVRKGIADAQAVGYAHILADIAVTTARKHDPSEARERELMLIPASPKDDGPDRQ